MNLNELKKSALQLLARREYSTQQLQQRLQTKTTDDQLVQQVIVWCQAENYQSDTRFVEMLLRSRLGKGYGPLYIQQECRRHGICMTLLQQQLAQLEPDWLELAQSIYLKKYGGTAITSASERAKRQRYLQQRGFYPEDCSAALKNIRS
ncbi:regulatory protein RecX [Alkalimonas amylolytica]|uniref:Regulatory protein RecX n=1 Tax=Alkalimonas amylolytica TaxID=152573 RepID=A0A1H4DUR8_ALKAM|nr:regulatory protein RecX [Alkalimonas amylolytica]SEA76533.1 regulatory protein [Alkalimonas amylolytica]